MKHATKHKIIHLNQSFDESNRRLLLKLVDKMPNCKFLDVGCNTGEFTIEVAKKLGTSDIYGLEIEEAAIRAAEQKGINVLSCDLNGRLPFKDKEFDFILANQVIEHLYYTDDFIKEIKRILKPKGTLLLSTTNLAALHYRAMLLLGMQPVGLHPSEIQFGNFLRGTSSCGFKNCHKSVFTYKALKEFLNYYGFKIIAEAPSGIYPLPDFISKPVLRIFPNWGVWSTFKVKK